MAILAQLLDQKIEKIETKLGDKVDSLETRIVEKVTEAVSESISEKVSKKVDEKIEVMIEPINQRHKDFEESTVTMIGDLQKQITSLTDLVKNPAHKPDEFPQLQCTQAAVSFALPRPRLASQSNTTSTASTSSDSVKDIIEHARRVIGVAPVTPSHLESQGVAHGEEALLHAAIEYLRKELNVRESEIADSDIEEVFLPARSTRATFSKVYIRFKAEDSANLCLHLAKSLTDRENKITRYFPRQFNARAAALGHVAYKMRRSNPPYKTSIEYTEDDLVLLVCPRGQFTYRQYMVENIPPIDLTPARSPPVGRKKKRERSASKSPPKGENKKGRTESSIEIEGTDTEVEKNDDKNETADDEQSDNPTSTQTEILPSDPAPPTLDRGLFQNLQASSPLTGKISFDFETVPSRRMSLNF